jgi:IPT/TIG domain
MKGVCVVMLTLLSFGCGYGTQKSTPATPGVVPTISGLAPNSAAAGTGFTLTVNGSNFASNSTINFNASAQTTRFVTANQLTADIPAAMVASPGAVTVTVTNPGTPGGMYGGGTQSETSSGTPFTVN